MLLYLLFFQLVLLLSYECFVINLDWALDPKDGINGVEVSKPMRVNYCVTFSFPCIRVTIEQYGNRRVNRCTGFGT